MFPAALKDALDWLVGSGDLYEKPVAVLSVAPSAERGGNRVDLERTLRGQGARDRVVDDRGSSPRRLRRAIRCRRSW